MASHGESVGQATVRPRRGTADGAGVRAIVAAVARLLMDYVVQLREDLRLSDTSAEAKWGGKARSGLMVEDTDGSEAAGYDKVATHSQNAARRASDAEDEAAPLSELDTAEVRQLLERLQRVKRLLTQFSGGVDNPQGGMGDPGVASECFPEPNDWEGDAYRVSCMVVRQNSVLMLALRRFDGMIQRFEGTATSTQRMKLHSGERNSRDTIALTSETRASASIQLLMSPVSLAEGALSAFSRNVNILFRRRQSAGCSASTGKRLRDEAGESGASSSELKTVASEQLNCWSALSAQQRRRRFAVYTARSALLPRVNAVCAPLYVSPSIQDFAELNLEAERIMLKRAWCVHTKAHLLRGLPWVAGDIAEHRSVLREVLHGFPESQKDAFLADVVYADFLSCENGVVRVCVQHGLLLDLTYDVRRRQWTLLSLHWNLFTTSAGASLISGQTAVAVPYAHGVSVPPLASPQFPLDTLAPQRNPQAASDTPSSPFHASASMSVVRIVPRDSEALYRFLQQAFAQDGLSGGLQAANRLLCAVVMDTFATQLQTLQQCFFTGSTLGRYIDADVRPGTLISFHVSLPQLFVPLAPTAHVKMSVAGGTVVLECVRGTDLSTRQVTLPIGTSSLVTPAAACENSATWRSSVPVLDMEALLWQCARSCDSS